MLETSLRSIKCEITKVLSTYVFVFFNWARTTPLLNAIATRKCNRFSPGKSLEPLLVNRSPSELFFRILPFGTAASGIGFRLNANDTPFKYNEILEWNKLGLIFKIFPHFLAK